MPSRSTRSSAPTQTDSQTPPWRGDLSVLARDLVDKVGIDGAARYCSGLGWRGVLEQVEMLRHGR